MAGSKCPATQSRRFIWYQLISLSSSPFFSCSFFLRQKTISKRTYNCYVAFPTNLWKHGWNFRRIQCLGEYVFPQHFMFFQTYPPDYVTRQKHRKNLYFSNKSGRKCTACFVPFVKWRSCEETESRKFKSTNLKLRISRFLSVQCSTLPLPLPILYWVTLSFVLFIQYPPDEGRSLLTSSLARPLCDYKNGRFAA